MGDEAQAMMDRQQGEEALERMRDIEEDNGIHVTDSDNARLHFAIRDMLNRYSVAESASVRCFIRCPACNAKIRKRSYQHKFCGTHCKDRYWNTVDDRRRKRAIGRGAR